MKFESSIMLTLKILDTQSPFQNLNYIIEDSSTQRGIIIDPYSAGQIQLICSLDMNQYIVFNTHEHKDHVLGNKELSSFVKDIVSFESALDDQLNHHLKNDFDLYVIEGPGHTHNHRHLLIENKLKISFQVELYNAQGIKIEQQTWSQSLFFSGDTIFELGVGNCKNGGNLDVLFQTLESLKVLIPSNAIVLSGHDYAQKNFSFLNDYFLIQDVTPFKGMDTSLSLERFHSFAFEKMYNPFLNLDIPLKIPLSGPLDRKSEFCYRRGLRDRY